ncbi:CHAT domain-containing protein [Actinoplanes regularis]|uniref:CHAT domain-containing protein n=1 Tax=Actinoplanes regularis TaxID=52697 RepID=A0A238WA34_9ACTN|nr:CHAT domain-containing protein [Actinoplanes regularis]GIE85182.1 hypothetical protein Are01nite_16620 [Actinoplanes regularis]SNR42569.1 CHAT domain-containing protein [Actinoplanes regularis]
MTALDAELAVSADGTTVTLTVTGRPAATAKVAGDLDVAHFAGALDRRMPADTRAGLGRTLFDAVIRDETARLWAELEEDGSPLRLRLHLPPPLRALPWELLASGTDRLALRRASTLWRGVPPRPGDPIDGPLRVLVVVCNPTDRQVLGDEELAGLTGAAAEHPAYAHVEIVDGPDRDRLTKEIDRLRPHVLHFIGHGMPRVPGRAAALAFNWVTAGESRGTVWELPSTEIGLLVSEQWVPRLVVLNACRTAADPLDQVGGVGEAFLRAGAGAVVAMQADVESPAAADFAAHFYRGVFAGAGLDRAVAAARTEMARTSGDTGEWAMPVLTCRLDPADVLRTSFRRLPDEIAGLVGRPEYAMMRNFLDHASGRRDAWWALDPPEGEPRSLLVVGGRSSNPHKPTGKTWFTRCCLLTYFLRGYRVTYVDVGVPLARPDGEPARTKTWLHVLRMIREACTAPEQAEPLPASAFAGFEEVFDRLAGTPDGAAGQWWRFDENRPRAAEHRDRILDAFRTALAAAAAERPHVIALDNAEQILPESFDGAIYPGLLRPVGAGRGGVRVMLVGKADWLAERLPVRDEAYWGPLVTIGDFQAAQMMRLARDYCRRRGFDFHQLERVFQVMSEVEPQTWVTRFNEVLVALGLIRAVES